MDNWAWTCVIVGGLVALVTVSRELPAVFGDVLLAGAILTCFVGLVGVLLRAEPTNREGP